MTEPQEEKRPRYSATAKLTRIEVLVIEQALTRMASGDLTEVEKALLADTLDHMGKVRKQFT